MTKDTKTQSVNKMIQSDGFVSNNCLFEAQANIIKSIDYDAHNNLLRHVAVANARIVEFEDIKKMHLAVQEKMQEQIDALSEYLLEGL